MNIILLGKPGVGKGYVAQVLKNEYDFYHISTGALCRKNVAENTELGMIANEFMQKGELVPSEIVFKMLQNELKYVQNKHCVFDGYPRTIEQATELAKIIDVDAVVFVDVPDNVLIDRVLARKSCVKCGMVADISKEQNICPKCGGSFATRVDDNVQVVKNRLDVYNQQTAPLLEYYFDKIIPLDNSGEWENTKQKIKQIIENLLMSVG